ncbi:MAG TPA: FCD domain-containing protein, partial [Gemmatimonadales bacterium]|nr:FCD domain-containing protein [Gemmatimonadales bacterium]
YWLTHGIMLKHRRTFEREHRALLAAIGDRDADRAARLLEEHLAGAAQHLISAIDEGRTAATQR